MFSMNRIKAFSHLGSLLLFSEATGLLYITTKVYASHNYGNFCSHHNQCCLSSKVPRHSVEGAHKCVCIHLRVRGGADQQSKAVLSPLWHLAESKTTSKRKSLNNITKIPSLTKRITVAA
jgi:hypothetical protein